MQIVICVTNEEWECIPFKNMRIGDIAKDEFNDIFLKTTRDEVFNFSSNKAEMITNPEYQCYMINTKLLVQR